MHLGQSYPSAFPVDSKNDPATKLLISPNGNFFFVSQILYDSFQQIPKWNTAEIEDRDSQFYRTPVHDAAKDGDVERDSHLLAKGANIRILDYHGKAPFYYAISNQYHAVMKLFVEAEANPIGARTDDSGLVPVKQHSSPNDNAWIQGQDYPGGIF